MLVTRLVLHLMHRAESFQPPQSFLALPVRQLADGRPVFAVHLPLDVLDLHRAQAAVDLQQAERVAGFHPVMLARVPRQNQPAPQCARGFHDGQWEIFPKVVDGGGSKGILRVNLFS